MSVLELDVDAGLGSGLTALFTPKAEHPLIANPEGIFSSLGWKADAWQLGLLKTRAPYTLVLCPRQVGKSATAAAKSLVTAITRPNSLSMIVSRSQNQASEVLLKVKMLHAAYRGLLREKRLLTVSREAQQWKPSNVTDYDDDEFECPASVSDAKTYREFSNGSRIIATACSSSTTVGNTTDLVILDEAARMPDPVYYSIRPTLAIAQSAGKGELIVLSTPFGKRGWFYEAWKQCEDAKRDGNKPDWNQVSIKVEECPRISPEFLASEMRAMGRHWFDQEYRTVFREAMDSVFSSDDIDRAIVDTGKELFEEI